MPTFLGRLTLFLSSYAPLWVVFGLLDTFGPGWPTVVCVVLAAVAPLVLLCYFIGLREIGDVVSVTALSVQRAEAETFAYVATFLVPFAGIGVTDSRGRMAVLVFLMVLGTLYVRGQLFYLNPILALAGFRFFRLDIESGSGVQQRLLLSRSTRLEPTGELTVRRIGNDLLIEFRKS